MKTTRWAKFGRCLSVRLFCLFVVRSLDVVCLFVCSVCSLGEVRTLSVCLSVRCANLEVVCLFVCSVFSLGEVRTFSICSSALSVHWATFGRCLSIPLFFLFIGPSSDVVCLLVCSVCLLGQFRMFALHLSVLSVHWAKFGRRLSVRWLSVLFSLPSVRVCRGLWQ